MGKSCSCKQIYIRAYTIQTSVHGQEDPIYYTGELKYFELKKLIGLSPKLKLLAVFSSSDNVVGI